MMVNIRIFCILQLTQISSMICQFTSTNNDNDLNSIQFNVDTTFPIIIDPVNQQQPIQRINDDNNIPLFSSLIAIENVKQRNFLLLMGTPNLQEYYKDSSVITGAVFVCPIIVDNNANDLNKKSRCDRIFIDDNAEIYGSNLQYKQSNKSLFGMTMQLTKKMIIICAPNWVGPDDTPEGICFIMDRQQPNRQQLIFKYLREQLVRSNRPYESHNLFGFSIAYNENNNELLFGLPGFKDFSGTVCRFSDQLSLDKIKLNEYRKTTTNTYTGFDVDYYPIDDAYYLLLVSTPKYSNFKGKIEFIDINSQQILLTLMSKNDTMSEFYGSTMHVVDIDGDLQMELLVGAPLFSINSKRREIGRVYLYTNLKQSIINDGNSRLHNEQIINSPSKLSGGKFGSNIASIDLNHDRFMEVIISAPFEQNFDKSNVGAIYIYYGTWRGLDMDNYKRIAPENLRLQQHQFGFGFNLWTENDFDSNGYNDLVIGTLHRSFVLRSYPIIEIKGLMLFEPSGINFTQTQHCKHQQHQSTCFLVKYCIDLSSNRFKFDQNELSFLIQIAVTDRNLDLKEDRVKQKFHNQTIRTKSKHYCSNNSQSIQFNLKNKEDIFDIITPIELKLSIELLHQQPSMKKFCSNCPVANTFSAYQEIGFEYGCAQQICKSKLILDTDVKYGPRIVQEMIIEGQYNTFDVNALITNHGESSINTQMIIRIEPVLLNLMPSSDFSRCHLIEAENHYRCDVNKLMITKQKEKFILRFDAQSLQSRYIYWNFELKTSSEIDDESQLIYQKNITIKKEIDFIMRMQMENYYNFSNFIPHVLFPVSIVIEKSGASNIDSIYLQLDVPWMIEMEQPFQYRCNKIKQGSEKSVRIDLVNGTLKMSCSDNPNGCTKYQCKLNHFDFGFRLKNFDITLLFISSRIKSSSLIKYNEVILETSFQLFTNDSIFFEKNKLFDNIKPLFTFVKQQNYENDRYQNLIIFGSAGLGIVIIILTTCILIKYGFFKRKKFEELKKERQSMMNMGSMNNASSSSSMPQGETTMMLPTMMNDNDNQTRRQEIKQIGSIS